MLKVRPVNAARLSRLPLRPHTVRFQTTSPITNPSKPSSPKSNLKYDAIVGGVVGGSLVSLAGYSYYHFSGAKTVINTVRATKSYFEETLHKTKQSAPPPNEAIQWLRDTAMRYASVIPGGKGYVDTAFKDLETIHQKHGGEVDAIVREAYQELQEVGSSGSFDMASVARAWDVLQRHMGRIGELAKDAGGDILNNHPHLRDRFGGEFDKVKQMGENYGPEAKKMADQTWNQVQDALKGGFSMETFDKLKGIVQDGTEQLQKVGEQAWQKAMEQAKPYLDKNPQLKKLIEENKTQLMKGNAMELLQKIKDTFNSGKTDDLEKYVQETINKGKSSMGGGGGVGSGGGGSGSLEKYLNTLPSGGSIWANLSQLQEATQKHGHEAEQLMKEALDEVHQVLSRKVAEGKKLAEKVKQDSAGK